MLVPMTDAPPSKLQTLNSMQLLQVITVKGLAAFVEVLQERPPTLPVLRRLDAAFRDPSSILAPAQRKQLLGVLEQHVEERGLSLYARSGRPPETGDRRRYRAQQAVDNGQVYIRLPLDSLGVKKGDSVSCDFGAGVVTVRALSSGAK